LHRSVEFSRTAFDAAQIDRLEQVAGDLHQLCLEAVDQVVRKQRFAELVDACACLPATRTASVYKWKPAGVCRQLALATRRYR